MIYGVRETSQPKISLGQKLHQAQLLCITISRQCISYGFYVHSLRTKKSLIRACRWQNWYHLVCILFFSGGTLGFFLKGVAYPDGSTVLRADIGEGEDALQCTTDSTTCCTNNAPEMRDGQFYMPDGSQVPVHGVTTAGYYRTRESQSILLHRRSFGTITGLFQCYIPSGPIVADLYINIGEYKAISA